MIDSEIYDSLFIPRRNKSEWIGHGRQRREEIASFEWFSKEKKAEIQTLEGYVDFVFESAYFRHVLLRFLYGVVEGPDPEILEEDNTIALHNDDLSKLEEIEPFFGSAAPSDLASFADIFSQGLELPALAGDN